MVLGMSAFALVGSYLALLAVFLFIMLFGESRAFQGTIVERAHDFITRWLWVALMNGVARACGKRGAAALGALEVRAQCRITSHFDPKHS